MSPVKIPPLLASVVVVTPAGAPPPKFNLPPIVGAARGLGFGDLGNYDYYAPPALFAFKFNCGTEGVGAPPTGVLFSYF